MFKVGDRIVYEPKPTGPYANKEGIVTLYLDVAEVVAIKLDNVSIVCHPDDIKKVGQ